MALVTWARLLATQLTRFLDHPCAFEASSSLEFWGNGRALPQNRTGMSWPACAPRAPTVMQLCSHEPGCLHADLDELEPGILMMLNINADLK